MAQWIQEVEADRDLANSQLKEQKSGPRVLEEGEIADYLEAIGDLATMIREVDRETKSDLCTGLGFRLRHHP